MPPAAAAHNDKSLKPYGVWCVGLHNANVWNSARAALIGSATDVLLADETLLDPYDIDGATAAARVVGISASLGAGSITEGGGVCAGCAVAARAHI